MLSIRTGKRIINPRLTPLFFNAEFWQVLVPASFRIDYTDFYNGEASTVISLAGSYDGSGNFTGGYTPGSFAYEYQGLTNLPNGNGAQAIYIVPLNIHWDPFGSFTLPLPINDVSFYAVIIGRSNLVVPTPLSIYTIDRSINGAPQPTILIKPYIGPDFTYIAPPSYDNSLDILHSVRVETWEP